MIGRTVSHFRILRELGHGGMGVVYEAEDTRLGRHVALKFLPPELAKDPQALARFRREAKAASSLDHPNICTVYDIGEYEGQPFITMQYLHGQSLRQRIASSPLPPSALLDLGVQIADALEAAHSKGIVHRDIKPANIFVVEGGQVKVLDFGLAKLAALRPPLEAGDTSIPTMSVQEEYPTTPGTAMGTLAYMSPEQVRGEELDRCTDLFSFAAVLYEAATSTMAFHGKTQGMIFDAILNRNPTPPSHLNPKVPPEFDRIVEKALDKDRHLRYQTALDLGADLKRLQRQIETGRAATVPITKPAWRPRWVHVGFALFIAVLGVGALIRL